MASPLPPNSWEFGRLRLEPSSADVTNTVSPQMIGVAAAQLGSFVRQTTFSVVLQVTGRLDAELVPSRFGPRHCGQLSPAAAKAGTSISTSNNRFIPSILSSGSVGPCIAC